MDGALFRVTSSGWRAADGGSGGKRRRLAGERRRLAGNRRFGGSVGKRRPFGGSRRRLEGDREHSICPF